MTRLAVLAAVAIACLAAGAARAAADTIVYVKGGVVDVARADGSGARAVTPPSKWWAWPSESDGGIIAVAGSPDRIDGGFDPPGSDQIYEFNQQGTKLAGPVNTEASYSQVIDPIYVSHFRVAPDNSYVAWTTNDPAHGLPYVAWEKPTSSSFHTANDSDGAPLEYSNPEWWGPQHLLMTHDGVTFGSQSEYVVHSLADGSNPGWYEDEAIGSASSFQVAISHSGRTYAVMTDDAGDYGGTAHNVAITLETTSTPPTDPTDVNTTHCTITLPAGEFPSPNGTGLASMSFSSDDHTLAWGENDGIYEADVADPANCGQDTGSVHRVIAGGAMPFLSPAPLGALKPLNTRITRFAIHARSKSATIRFTARGSGHPKFQCRLNRGHWQACSSPVLVRGLTAGRYTFAVRARVTGRTDPTPAIHRFRIRRR